MTNFASIAVEIPEYYISGVADGVLTTDPPLPSSDNPNPNLGTLWPTRGSVAWIYGTPGADRWFVGCDRRLAVFVGGGYVMQTSVGIESKTYDNPPVSHGSAVLPPGWALLAIV